MFQINIFQIGDGVEMWLMVVAFFQEGNVM